MRKEEEEKKRKEEEDRILKNIKTSPQVAESQTELQPIEVPVVNTHSALSDVSSYEGQEEEVFNLTRITYDQFSFKIRQEKMRCLARNPSAPSTTAMDKDIVLDTRNNPVMIALVDITFTTAMEENLNRMSREILSLQNKLQEAEQREARAEQEKAALKEEIQQFQEKTTPVNEVPLTVRRELDVLEITMRQVYGEMFTIKQTVSPC